jgi:hypothetical protein
LFDALDIARTRSVSKTIQRVENGFVHVEVGNGKTFENGAWFLLFVFCGRRYRCGIVCGVKAGREKQCGSEQRRQKGAEM